MRWLALVALLFLPLTALAQKADDARATAAAHHETAIRFYQDGRYDLARIEFEAAFALSKEPDMLFNVARCFEKEGNEAQVAATLERYLQLKEDPEARKKLDVLLAKLAPRPQAPSATQPPTPAAVQSPPTPPAQPADTKPRSSLSTRARVGVALAVVGGACLVAAIGTGAAAGVQRASLLSGDLTYSEAQTTAQQASQNRAAAIGLAVAGGVVGAGGVVLAVWR